MPEFFTTSLQVARKEFRGFFTTPAAYLFLAGFLAVTLFIFFWADPFFARNIADVRPLFEWMPLLLIFLVAAMTMRSWSEERRSGTLESLLTAPASPAQLVFGKFLAALALVALALVLTLPLPVTVSWLGPLDWGPVIGGYIAALFLAAAYISIGLYTSSRTDNPIVALILTSAVCGILYLIGSGTLTNLFGYQASRILGQLGTGSRFESITRGVLDIRDLYYYLSIMGVFLALNLYTLEKLRWAGNPPSSRHRLHTWTTRLVMANFVAANLWLAPINWLRTDITDGSLYSLSDATARQLAELQEPLVIRGYFSAKTHPLLAPLVPQLEDLLEEYAIASKGRVRVEFVDPTKDRDAEEEAASRFGIRPVPFQTADRYQSSVVNAYFDLVVAYGDQYETLGFRDLIEFKAQGESDLDVVLKNPEYSITRAIRKVEGSYQASGQPFEGIQNPVTFQGYISPDSRLPAPLRQFRLTLNEVLDSLAEQSDGKLEVHYADPDAGDGALARKLNQDWGLNPQLASLLDPEPFWFYMMLESNGETLQIPLPETLDRSDLERSLKNALQRFTPGVLKTVAVFRPQAYGAAGHRYSNLEQMLGENVRIRDTDLKSGQVPEDADLLLVLAPDNLDEHQRFAIDQFLMRGGSVIVTTSPFDITVANSFNASKHQSGLEDWLQHMGIGIEDSMVLDPQNAALPIPVERYVGGLALQEIRMLPYPHFPDIRGDGLNSDNPVTASLQQLTLNWASPVSIDQDSNSERQVIRLLTSSPESWTSSGLNLVPDYNTYPDTGFKPGDERKPQVLAVAIEGRFDSFYKGKSSPLAVDDADSGPDKQTADGDGDSGDSATRITSVIDRSPESARLIVVAANTFATDTALQLASQGLGTLYTKPLAFMQNAIDWSLEDPGLLALRGRTQLARTLRPLPEDQQRLWEFMNYTLALLGLVLVWVWRRRVASNARKHYAQILSEV